MVSIQKSSDSPVERLFAVWKEEARDEYQSFKSAANFKCSEMGTVGGSGHIMALCGATEQSAMAMIEKARVLPLESQFLDCFASNVLEIFDELAAISRQHAIGRSRQIVRNGELADRVHTEHRKRTAMEIEKWKLEAAMLETSSKKLSRSPSYKTGYPPNSELIMAKADELYASGKSIRWIASNIRHEVGFENVGTVEMRELLKGKYPKGPRRTSPK